MTNRFFQKSLGMIAAFGLFSTADAALFDQGNGLIYDDVLGISWLQNANLAAENSFGVLGIDANGGMQSGTAHEYINAMNAANYLGYNTWRLPTVSPVDGVSFNLNKVNDGSADKGYNISSPNHEMAHLYYSTLGNLGLCEPRADHICDETPGGAWGPHNTGPFQNVREWDYWYGTGNPEIGLETFAFGFNFGSTGTLYFENMLSIIPVLDGGASPVPVPAAVWLFLTGFLGLAALSRRSKS
ncbi:MAG: VPLPA-CTERM sorting domain-containing protein [Candidatus Thiodiazotropha sp.]